MLEPTEEPVRCVIQYHALAKVVELLVDGRMMQGDASALSKGGWTFKINDEERIHAIASAAVLESKLLSLPKARTRVYDDGLIHECDPGGRNRQRWHRKVWGLKPEDVAKRLEEDEVVFNIARPEDLMAKPLSNRGQGTGCFADGSLPTGGGKPVANSLTYSQRKQMKGREQEQQKRLGLEVRSARSSLCRKTAHGPVDSLRKEDFT